MSHVSPQGTITRHLHRVWDLHGYWSVKSPRCTEGSRSQKESGFTVSWHCCTDCVHCWWAHCWAYSEGTADYLLGRQVLLGMHRDKTSPGLWLTLPACVCVCVRMWHPHKRFLNVALTNVWCPDSALRKKVHLQSLGLDFWTPSSTRGARMLEGKADFLSEAGNVEEEEEAGVCSESAE